MTQWHYESFENQFLDKASQLTSEVKDPSHDLLHIKRVVKIAKHLALIEKANLDIVVPASYFHDYIQLPKNHPDRKMASQLSARAAIEYLESINYPKIFFREIEQAIKSHSYSAGISAQSLESKIVQDADRLDAIGAVGVSRCLTVSALLQRPYYSEIDPFCSKRMPDDSLYTIDHFYKKLLVICDTMQTSTAQTIAAQRKQFMTSFLNQLKHEI